MNRYQQKARSTERKQKLNPDRQMVETDPEIIKKLMSGEAYTTGDIKKCLENILESHQKSFDYRIIDHSTNLELDQYPTAKPLFLIYELKVNHWVLCCLLSNNKKNYALYKDPTGKDMNDEMTTHIKGKVKTIEFILNTKKDQQIVLANAPLVLRNVDLIMKTHKKSPSDLIKNFKDLNFYTVDDLDATRLDQLYIDIVELGKNEEFKKNLGEFLDAIPLEIEKDVDHYREVLEKEVMKDDESKIDVEKIKKAKDELMQSKQLEKFKKEVEVNKGAMEKEEKLHKKHNKEMNKLQEVFKLINQTKGDDNLLKGLKSIAETLGIAFQKLKNLYAYKFKKKEEEKECDAYECIDIDKLKLPRQEPVVYEKDVSSLEELLSTLVLGPDPKPVNNYFQKPQKLTQEEFKKSYQNDAGKLHLEQLFHKIRALWPKWEYADAKKIHEWAKAKRGKLGETEDELCEALAVMERGFNLYSGKFRLRDAQLLSTLIFLDKGSTEGRLSQIETGEGKTYIVALVAVFKVLQGKTVDVITSNPVLAQEGVDEMTLFYHLFNVTVATNNTNAASKERKLAELEMDYEMDENKRMDAYTADVVYGTMSSFQFDYLKDIVEGYNVRQNRTFDVVILDEVDSMLIDNGAHIAKLTTPFPGMESLRYIYIKIWQELQKCEEEYFKTAQQNVEKKLKDLKDTYSKGKLSKEVIHEQYEDYVCNMIISQLDEIRKKIKESFKSIRINLIPAHLRKYADKKLDVWINNALYAKYKCHEHQQYRLEVDPDTKEKKVVPIDYLNTGIMMKNTVWSNGLHQFIQLKHNLLLTYESLTSSFISNIGYIKGYKSHNIFGMTGTLGSVAEQQLLRKIYQLNFAKVPPYKPKEFDEIPNKLDDDEVWSVRLCTEILDIVDQDRAVLLICETESDLMEIREDLNLLKKSGADFNLRIYMREEDKGETKKKVEPKDIILSTNLAGRGTNFKTTKDLEKNGGLHVVVGFLPYNLRVESQAYGRTARQGNRGTAQLFIRRSETNALKLQGEKAEDFNEIKRKRDFNESSRLEEIRKNKLDELNFKDELFGYFATLHRTMKQRAKSKEANVLLRDLKEFWAFWLENEDFNSTNIAGTTPEQQFENFKLAAKKLLTDNEIIHNPFYYIELADYAIERNDNKKAKEYLEKAVEFTKDNYALLYGAYIKLFNFSIEMGNQVKIRLQKALAKTIFLNLSIDESYKTNGLNYLKKAQFCLEKELEFIKENFGLEEEENPDTGKPLISIVDEEEDENEKNELLKHINSRFVSLRAFKENVDDLIKNINNIGTDGVIISEASPDYLEKLNKQVYEEHKVELVGHYELAELAALGLDAVYAVKAVRDVPIVIIRGAQVQFGLGIAALAAGLAFPPIWPVMSSLAGTLISEAIIDLVMEIISGGDQEFSLKEYIKGKFISYGISLLTMGISALMQSAKVVSKALEYCKKLSNFLKKSKYLKPLCEKLAKVVDKVIKILEEALTKIKFEKLSKLKQLKEMEKLKHSNLSKFAILGGDNQLAILNKVTNNGLFKEPSKMKLFIKTVTNIIKDTGKKFLENYFKEKVLKPLMDKIFKELVKFLKEKIKEKILEQLKANEKLKEKVIVVEKEKIDETIKEYFKKNPYLNIAEKIAKFVLKKVNNIVLDMIAISVDSILTTVKIVQYFTQSADDLEKKLPSEGKAKNIADEMLDDIATKLSDKVYELILHIIENKMSMTDKILEWKKRRDNRQVVIYEGDKEVDGKGKGKKTLDDDYEFLGLKKDATNAEVKKRYYELALRLHPDKNRDDPKATANFQEMEESFRNIKQSRGLYFTSYGFTD